MGTPNKSECPPSIVPWPTHVYYQESRKPDSIDIIVVTQARKVSRWAHLVPSRCSHLVQVNRIESNRIESNEYWPLLSGDRCHDRRVDRIREVEEKVPTTEWRWRPLIMGIETLWKSKRTWISFVPNQEKKLKERTSMSRWLRTWSKQEVENGKPSQITGKVLNLFCSMFSVNKAKQSKNGRQEHKTKAIDQDSMSEGINNDFKKK